MVLTPPPTVETMVRPTLLVLVTTSPRVREGDEAPVEEGDWPAEDEVDVVGFEPEPATLAPLDEVLVDVVVEGVLWPAPAGVVDVPALGLEGVLEAVSPP